MFEADEVRLVPAWPTSSPDRSGDREVELSHGIHCDVRLLLRGADSV